MNWIVGEPIHITSEDVEPADDASVHEFLLAVLNAHFPETPPNEEKESEWKKNTQKK